MSTRATTKTDSRLAARVAAIASVGAAMIHIAVVPPHWREWLASGLFFACIAVFQLIWARLAWARPTTAVLTVGILVNAGSAALWVMSRIAGAPFGPHAGEPEAVQAAGICALLLECYVVMGAAWVWYRGHRIESVSKVGNAMVLLGASAVIAAAVTMGTVSGMQHHHAPAEAEADHHAPIGEHTNGHHDDSEMVVLPDTEATRPATAPSPAQPAPLVADSSHGTDDAHHHDE